MESGGVKEKRGLKRRQFGGTFSHHTGQYQQKIDQLSATRYIHSKNIKKIKQNASFFSLRKTILRFAQCVLSMHAGGMVGANLIKPEMKASLFDARTCLTFLAFFCRESPSEKSVGCIFSIGYLWWVYRHIRKNRRAISKSKVRLHLTCFSKFHLICQKNVPL